MPVPILYNYFRSSASYRVRCALHYKEISFEYRPVHLVKDGGEQFKLEFKKLNPMAQVPCLIDGDFVLGESMAIIQYLDAKWKNKQLFPRAPDRWAPILQVCEIFNSGVQPYQNVIVLNKLEKEYGLDEEKRNAWVRFFNVRGLESAEKLLQKSSGLYSFGDEITAADCFVVPQMFAANRFKVDVSKFPTLNKIVENCNKLEAFQKAHPAKQIDFQ